MRLEILHRSPTSPARAVPVLFIHGAWHAAWCWDEHFLTYFAERGYDSYALSMRGHGQSEGRERLRWTSAAEYVEDVAQAVAQLPAPPVIVAHSMGGFVLQKYLETHTAPAAVLLASIPPTGSILFLLRFIRKYPLGALKVLLTLRLYPVMNPPHRAAYWCFSPDLPPDKAAAYSKQVQDESFRALLDTALLVLPRTAKIRQGGTLLLVLGARNDRIFSNREVEHTSRAYGTQAEFFPNMAHDMMLENGWQSVADRIIVWLDEQNL